MRTITPRLSIEAFYILAVGTLAIIGVAPANYSARPILALDALVSLPCGLAALVGLYMLTGIFNSYLGGAHGFLFDASVVACYVIAATINVAILRLVIAGKADRTATLSGSTSLAGLTLDDALNWAKRHGVREVRTIEVQGGKQVRPVLMDFRSYRLNLWIALCVNLQ